LTAAAAAMLLLPAFCAPVFGAAAIPEYKDEYGYVADLADVLTADTIYTINEANLVLTKATGAEIIIVTVDFLNGAKIEDYAYRLFNQWKIGSAEKDNGLLLLLVIGEDNYYALQGKGLESQFSSSLLDEYLNDYLEADFDAGRYDAGVRRFFDASLERLERIYGVTVKSDLYPGGGAQPGVIGDGAGPSTPRQTGLGTLIGNIMRFIFGSAFIVLFLVLFIIRRLLRGPRFFRPFGYKRPRRVFRPIIFGGFGFRRPRRHYHPPVGKPYPKPVRSPVVSRGLKPPGAGLPGAGKPAGRIGGGGMSRGGGAGRSSGFGGLSGGGSSRSGGFSSGSRGGSFGGGSRGGSFGGGRSGGGGMSRGGGAGRR